MTEIDPRLTAGIAMLRRTGAREVQVRYQDDEQPVVWLAVASYGVENGVPVAEGGDETHEAAAALDPVRAVLRLCERLIDGGQCSHCHRPTGFEPDSLDTMPLDKTLCWYQWDPELETFRRGSE